MPAPCPSEWDFWSISWGKICYRDYGEEAEIQWARPICAVANLLRWAFLEPAIRTLPRNATLHAYWPTLVPISGLAMTQMRRAGCSGHQSDSWLGVGKLCANGATWGMRVETVGSCVQAPDGTDSN